MEEINKVFVFAGKPVPTEKYPERLIMVAMDGKTGAIIKTHLSTDIHWGLKDIGYVQPGTVKGKYARQLFGELYPEGYTIEHLGNQTAGNKKLLEILSRNKPVVKTKKKKGSK